MDDRAAHGIFSLVRISSSADTLSAHISEYHTQGLFLHCPSISVVESTTGYTFSVYPLCGTV